MLEVIFLFVIFSIHIFCLVTYSTVLTENFYLKRELNKRLEKENGVKYFE